MRCHTCLILSECYSSDLPSWFGVQPWNPQIYVYQALSKFLQPKQNFLNHLVTVLWSTVPSPFAQQMFLVAFMAFWPSLNLLIISSQIRLCCMLKCATFKSHTEWSNTKYVNTLTTMILPMTADTFSKA